MSADLKKELIPKMKAALAEVMNRQEATQEIAEAGNDSHDDQFRRSISDRLKTKLRPVPSRLAASAAVFTWRQSKIHGQTENRSIRSVVETEDDYGLTVPQTTSEGGKTRFQTEDECSRTVPQQKAKQDTIVSETEVEGGEAVPQTETADQRFQAGTCNGGDPRKMSQEFSSAEGGKSIATKWERLIPSKVPPPAGSDTTPPNTASRLSDAASSADAMSVPTIPVIDGTSRCARDWRRSVSPPRAPWSLADRAMTPSSHLNPPSQPLALSPHASSAHHPVMPSRDPRPPLPKIALSRGRNGAVRKKFIFSPETRVPSKRKEHGLGTSTRNVQSDGTKSRRCIRSCKNTEVNMPGGDESGSNSRHLRQRRTQSSDAETGQYAISASETAAASDIERGLGCLSEKCETQDDVSTGSSKENSAQLLDSGFSKPTTSLTYRGRGRCGRRRRVGKTLPGAGLQESPFQAVRRYARTGCVSRGSPFFASETGDCSATDGAGRGISKSEGATEALDLTKTGLCRSGSAVTKTTTPERSFQDKGPTRKVKRRGGGRRQENPSLAAIKQREYRARRQAMGGKPLGRARGRSRKSVHTNDSALADGPSSLSASRNAEVASASNCLDPAFPALLEKATISVSRDNRAKTSSESYNPAEIEDSPQPVSTENHRPGRGRKQTRVAISRSVSDRYMQQRFYRLSRGLTLGGRPKRRKSKRVASGTASVSYLVSGDEARRDDQKNEGSQQIIMEKEEEAEERSEPVPLSPVASSKPATSKQPTTVVSDTVGSPGHSTLPSSTTLTSDSTPVHDSIVSVHDSVEIIEDSVHGVCGPNTSSTELAAPDDAMVQDPAHKRRGSRRRRGFGKQRRVPGETQAEYKHRIELLHSGRALPFSRGRPVGPVLMLKRFLRRGWEPPRKRDLMPTPDEDNLVWETVIEVSTDADGNYAETFSNIEIEANRLYDNVRAAQEAKGSIDMENEVDADDGFSEHFCTSEEVAPSEYQSAAASEDTLVRQQSNEQPPRKIRRVRSLEEPQRSVHIAYRGERGEQVDVIDGFRFVSFLNASAMMRFSRREDQRVRRMRRRERRKSSRRAAVTQVKDEHAATVDDPSTVECNDPDWGHLLDLSDAELSKTEQPDRSQSSSVSSDLEAVTQKPAPELGAVEASELPVSEIGAAVPDLDDEVRNNDRLSPSASEYLKENRVIDREHQHSGTSLTNVDKNGDASTATDVIQESRRSRSSRFGRGYSRRQNPYKQIRIISREAFAVPHQARGPHSRIGIDTFLPERLEALIIPPAASTDTGIFSSPELDEYLRSHASLSVSFKIPGEVAAANMIRTDSPELVPPQQKRAPPLPPSKREWEPGEPRCRTVLERLAWLGYRSKEELEQGRAKQLAELNEREKTAEPEPIFEFESVPVKEVLRSRRRPASPCGEHTPLVTRAGRLLPLHRVTNRSVVVRRAWDNPRNALGTSLYAYDHHQQMLIRGSEPRNDDLSVSHGRGAFRVATPGQIVRPENVEAEVSGWRHREHRVKTVPVDCILARMAASAVCATTVNAVTGVKRTPQTRVKRRKLLTNALGQRTKQQNEEDGKAHDTENREHQAKWKRELKEKTQGRKEQKRRMNDQQLTDQAKQQTASEIEEARERETQKSAKAQNMSMIGENQQSSHMKLDANNPGEVEKEDSADKKPCWGRNELDGNLSQSDSIQQTATLAGLSGETSCTELGTEFGIRTPGSPGTPDNSDNFHQTATEIITSTTTEDVTSAQHWAAKTMSSSRKPISDSHAIDGGVSAARQYLLRDALDPAKSDDELKAGTGAGDPKVPNPSTVGDAYAYTRGLDIFELSMGTDMSPHLTQESSEQSSIGGSFPSRIPARYRTEMLRLGLPPPQRTEACSSSADQHTACSKEYCQLGCVCSSLACVRRQKEHCGRQECMLVCSCSDHTSASVPALPSSMQAIQTTAGYDPFQSTASFGLETSISVAGGRAKRARKVPVRFTKQDVWYDGPLTLLSSADSPPFLQSQQQCTLPVNLPTNDEDVMDKQYEQLGCRVAVTVPFYRLPPVRPFCLVHQVHNCQEYSHGDSCYWPPRQRLQQLGRNVALRSRSVPPTVSRLRHEHAARTFGLLKARKPLEFLPQQDSCFLGREGTVYKGAQAPHLPVPPRSVLGTVPLPEPINIQDVASVVRIVPAETEGKDVEVDEHQEHYAVRLHSGQMSVLSESPIRTGMTWRIQLANDVVVRDYLGRQFRNPSEGPAMTPVVVEGEGGQLRRVPLVTVNCQVKSGRSRLTNTGSGIILYPKKRPLAGEERAMLYRVNMKSHEIRDNGMVVLRQNVNGSFFVIGAVFALAEERQWWVEAIRIMCGLPDSVKSSAVRDVLHLLGIQHVHQLGKTNLPLVSVITSAATEKKSKVCQAAHPTVSTKKAETHQAIESTGSAQDDSSITSVNMTTVTLEGGAPNVDGDASSYARALSADSIRSDAESEAQQRKSPTGDLARKREASTEPPRVRLRPEDGQAVDVTQDEKRFKAAKTPPPHQPMASHQAKSQLKIAIKSDGVMASGNVAARTSYTGMSRIPVGQTMDKGAAAHVVQATDSGVTENGREPDKIKTMSSEPTSSKNACPEKTIISIQRREREALRLAIIAAQNTLTAKQLSSSPPVPLLSSQLAGQLSMGHLTSVKHALRCKPSDASLTKLAASGQAPATALTTSSTTKSSPAQPSRPATTEAPPSSETPADSSSLPVPGVLVGVQPTDSTQAASGTPSRVGTLSDLSAPLSIVNSKEPRPPGLFSVVKVRSVNGKTFIERQVTNQSSLASNVTVSAPSLGSTEAPALKRPCVSQQEEAKSGCSLKEATGTGSIASSQGLLRPNPQQLCGKMSTSDQRHVSKESPASSVSGNDQTSNLSMLSQKRAVKRPLKLQVVGSSVLVPSTSEKANKSHLAATSKKTGSCNRAPALKLMAFPSDSASKDQPTSRELSNANRTMPPQRPASQKPSNGKNLSSGARLSFVRMPPQRVQGRMVTARFGGKPSRWNMIELDKVPELMHVDGIPISLTRRYLRHAVHQIKSTGRPISTKANGVLVTIVWMPHLPDFVFLGPVVEDSKRSAAPVASSAGGALTAHESGEAAVISPRGKTTLGSRTSASVAAEKSASFHVTKTTLSSAAKPTSTRTQRTLVISRQRQETKDKSPLSVATCPTMGTPKAKTDALTQSTVGTPLLPPPPASTNISDPLSLSKELSATLERPGAAAGDESDDEILVLPPPPPRAPLDVILLDNSDVSEDELVLDTNAATADSKSCATPSDAPSTSETSGSGRTCLLPASTAQQSNSAATTVAFGATPSDASSTSTASDSSRADLLPVPTIQQSKSAAAVIALGATSFDASSTSAASGSDRADVLPVPTAQQSSSASVTSQAKTVSSTSSSRNCLLAGAKTSPSGDRRPHPMEDNWKEDSTQPKRAKTVPCKFPVMGRPRKGVKTSPAGDRCPRPVEGNLTPNPVELSPQAKLRKPALPEQSGNGAMPKPSPLPSARVPVNSRREYYAAKQSLEGLLFGRLENATPIRRKSAFVVNTATTEVKSQRDRNAELKVRLWHVSQKQRNLLSLLNRLLAELPLEKRIEKVAEIEDLLPFLQVRVEGDDLEPVMLLEKKVSQQPSQFRVIAPDSGASETATEPPDTGELSEM